jgi:hypothetical protein
MLTTVRSLTYSGAKSVPIFETAKVDFKGEMEGYVTYEV